jgi:nicotinamidase-related amidase
MQAYHASVRLASCPVTVLVSSGGGGAERRAITAPTTRQACDETQMYYSAEESAVSIHSWSAQKDGLPAVCSNTDHPRNPALDSLLIMAKKTAILLIDPYNDFLHPDGKLNGLLREDLARVDAIKHIRAIVAAARKYSIPIIYGLHQQLQATTYDGWNHMRKIHNSQLSGRAFEEGSWGAKIYEGLEPDYSNKDLIVSKHWSSSSFQNTDLDYQLRQRDIENVVLIGMTANACVESTARYAYDIGYHTTIITDAVAAFTQEQHEAAVKCWPLFAQQVMTAAEWIEKLQWTDSSA